MGTGLAEIKMNGNMRDDCSALSYFASKIPDVRRYGEVTSGRRLSVKGSKTGSGLVRRWLLLPLLAVRLLPGRGRLARHRIVICVLCTTTIGASAGAQFHLAEFDDVAIGSEYAGQGISADDQFFYTSSGGSQQPCRLARFSSSWEFLGELPISYDRNISHTGDIEVVGDLIYVPLTSFNAAPRNLLHIAWFNKNTLQFVAKADVLWWDNVYNIGSGDLAGVTFFDETLFVVEWQAAGGPTPRIFAVPLIDGVLDTAAVVVYPISTPFANGIESFDDYLYVSAGGNNCGCFPFIGCTFCCLIGGCDGTIDVYSVTQLTEAGNNPIISYSYDAPYIHAEGLTFRGNQSAVELWVAQGSNVLQLETPVLLNPCSSSGAGDCCDANGTVGCADPFCCGSVCAVDIQCCTSTWDELCAELAEILCAPPPLLSCCGNGIENFGENCENCPADVPCPLGMVCVNSLCTNCGNNVVDPEENCDNCPQDVPCPLGMVCVNGLCTNCGNGVVDPGENCDNCPQDVPCPPDTECLDGMCDDLCGNGEIDSGEDCENCKKDVPCPDGTECLDGMCVDLCGNGVVDTGENCKNCKKDVPCPDGLACVDLVCTNCPDGEIDPGENCENCPQDVQCPPGVACINGVCTNCGNGVADLGENCHNCPADVPCPPGAECLGSVCQVPCPWDCGGDNDGDVGIVDFLVLLAQWGDPGSCDFEGDGTVGIVDFLELLANWGACP